MSIKLFASKRNLYETVVKDKCQSTSVTVEHTTFDMHILLIAFIVVVTILPYSLKLAVTEGYCNTHVTSSFMCYHCNKIC
jgi:hypothetical protein